MISNITNTFIKAKKAFETSKLTKSKARNMKLFGGKMVTFSS